MSCMYKLIIATGEYNTSGLHQEKYIMIDEQKIAVMLLQDDNYVVLPLREQLDYYEHAELSAFRESVDDLIRQAADLARNGDVGIG